MKIDLKGIELPSNKKFGTFFSFIFILIAFLTSFYFDTKEFVSYIFLGLSLLFILLTIAKDDLLLPFNKGWMYIGLAIGMIVRPLVLGLIFFVLITPLSVFLRLIGRDELRIRKFNGDSFWRKRENPGPDSTSFNNQF
tara:strand:+ start:325 stop:738 length:414 start_codon:yes stop_codon:yes gene_type:complete